MAERKLISFDYAVKYLLRGKSKDDFVILGGFLSELTGRKIEVVSILEIKRDKVDPEDKVDPSDKVNRLDLKAQIDGGEFAVFEIQFLQEFDFFGNVLYGASRALVEQVSAGKLYDIKKVHSINILYYNLNAKREYLFWGNFDGFRGVHFEEESIPFAQTADKDSKALVELNPEYYLIIPDMFDEKLRGRFDEWIYILKNSAVRDEFTAAGIKEAKVKLDYLSMSPEDKRAYERYMDNLRSADSMILAAKVRGRAAGLAEVRAEVRAAGIAAGIEEGRLEMQREIVRHMYQAGFSIEVIARALALSVKDVHDILGL